MKACYLFVLSMIISLGGCGSSPPSTFYTLDSNEAILEVTGPKMDQVLVGVEPVAIPSYLNRPQIVTRNADDVTLMISEFNRWAEPLGESFSRTLANAISEKAGYPAAKPIGLNREQAIYRLQVEVQRFDGTINDKKISKNDKVFLDTWWTLSNSSGNIVYRTRSVFVQSAGESYSDLIRAEQRLVKELGETIADYVSKEAKKGKK